MTFNEDGIAENTDVDRHLEGCLRHLRRKFYATAGQTEIEGTNREFIKSVYLLGMIGKF